MADLSLLLAQQAYLLTQDSSKSTESDLWSKVSPVLSGPFDNAVRDLGLDAYSSFLNLPTLKEFLEKNAQPRRGSPDAVEEAPGNELIEETDLSGAEAEGLFSVPVIIESLPILYDFFINNGAQL